MCLECQSEAILRQQSAAAQVFGQLGGAFGSQCMSAFQRTNPSYAHIYKDKLAEIAANMEKTYMMIPSCRVRDKLEADCEYLKKLAKP